MTTLYTTDAFDYLRTEHKVEITVTHTGGGNWVAGIGHGYGYDEEQGVYRCDVNLGPLYLDNDNPAGTFSGESGDLYAVSIAPGRPDIVLHVQDQILPTLLSMLGIEDVNVSDAAVDLDDIATAMGDGWMVGCLGGNNYGVVDLGGTTITIDEGDRAGFVPVTITVGRQGDEEWTQLFHGTVWSADEIPQIVEDHASYDTEDGAPIGPNGDLR